MEIRGIFVADKTANLLGRPGTCPKQGTTFATRDVLGATSEIFLSPRSRIVKSSLQKSSVFITAGGFRSVPSGSDESLIRIVRSAASNSEFRRSHPRQGLEFWSI